MLSRVVMKIRFSLFTPMLNPMKERLILFCVVLQFTPDAMGVLVNSPCTKTSDWNTYHILCPTNQTIYIKRHVIEDGFNGLKFPALGCSASDGVYCGVELPTNNINLKNYHILDSAVDICNGRKECYLTKKYFLEAEAALKKFCNASLRPELQKTTFRQSIDYECVQDSQIMDMCLTENEIRHFNQPVYLRVLDADCTCNITGSVTRVEILQTMSVKLLIQSNDSNSFEHQNTDVSLYGVDIPVQADNLIITTENGSKSSLAMMKIVSKGSFSIQCCNWTLSSRSEHNIGYSSQASDLQFTGSLSTIKNTPFEDNRIATMQNLMNNVTDRETGNPVKFWIQGLTVILIFFALLVVFLLLLNIIQQKKERYLLLKILQKLNDRCPELNDEHCRTEISPSEDDKNYQEISNQFLCHPNTKQYTNSVYETDCMVMENSGVEQDDAGCNMTSLESKSNGSMLVNNDPNGVYELQKIT
ncbi:uncharacterized protein LOC128189129 isoform X1 [Crassostrea angulata]|uniref:uncharacterized protein LOC128189129 isoform X1 n=1 Tax=Magallana angulata TaxID=2784310 RepID=UPI0022B1698C|nr:uncharacterized protein LOC128189129 isoform X1 [Crassostrea angulata]